MKPAIFLDRDGTIIEDRGYMYTLDSLVFIPGAIDALKLLQKQFLLFLITNQSGIGEGFFSKEQFLAFNTYFQNLLRQDNIEFQKIYYCPHARAAGCLCKKPSPYFIKESQREFNLDVEHSFVVGDHPHDIEMARSVDAYGVYVLTGHGTKHRKELQQQPDYIAQDLYQAAQWIIELYIRNFDDVKHFVDRNCEI